MQRPLLSPPDVLHLDRVEFSLIPWESYRAELQHASRALAVEATSCLGAARDAYLYQQHLINCAVESEGSMDAVVEMLREAAIACMYAEPWRIDYAEDELSVDLMGREGWVSDEFLFALTAGAMNGLSGDALAQLLAGASGLKPQAKLHATVFTVVFRDDD